MKKRRLFRHRHKKHLHHSAEIKMKMCKEIFHGLGIKEASYKYNITEETVRKIIKSYINWKMVWVGPPFQEEMEFVDD